MAREGQVKRKLPPILGPAEQARIVEESRTGIRTIAGQPIDEIPLSTLENLLDKEGYTELLKDLGISKRDIRSGAVDPRQRTVSLEEVMGAVDPERFTERAQQSLGLMGLVSAEGTFVGADRLAELRGGTVSAAGQQALQLAEQQALGLLGFDPNAPVNADQAFLATQQYRAGLAAQGIRGSAGAGLMESPYVRESLRQQRNLDIGLTAQAAQTGLGLLQASNPAALPGFGYDQLNQWYLQALGQAGALINKDYLRDALAAATNFQKNQQIIQGVGLGLGASAQTGSLVNSYFQPGPSTGGGSIDTFGSV